jgi:arabinose-5-phosphate isomerase
MGMQDAVRAAARRDDLRAAWLADGRQVVQREGLALLEVARRLDESFCDAIELLGNCVGSVIVTGMGKAGLIGQKIAATFASTGTRSHFLHAGEAVHGDLGRVHPNDAVLVLSFSGETEEVARLLPPLRRMGTPIIALTGRADSRLGKAATVVLELGPLQEACPLGLAPSSSTTAMLAVGDALGLVLSRRRDFSHRDFAQYHPGGSLGLKLATVEEVMRPAAECRIARDDSVVRQVLIAEHREARRCGAIMLIDSDGRLAGIFTDSDLSRLLEKRRDEAIDGPIGAVMTRSPLYVRRGDTVTAALATIAGRKISELPVLDGDDRPVGMIDITDLVASIPFVAKRTQESETGHRERASSELGSRELGSRELGSRELGSRELGSRELGSREFENGESASLRLTGSGLASGQSVAQSQATSESDASEANASESNTSESNTSESNTSESSASESSASESSASESSASELETSELETGERDAAEPLILPYAKPRSRR